MGQFKNIVKSGAYTFLFTLGFIGISSLQPGAAASAADTGKAVSVKTIDYEEGYILINQGDNEKIYYSDAKQKTWTLLEGSINTDGYHQMDISWIAASKDYELNLKGDKNDTVVSVDLPKYNSSLKAKYNAISGILTFTNDNGATQFQWRKAASTDTWNDMPVDMLASKNSTAVEEFKQEMELLRAKGGKISVRLAQVPGDADNSGSRPSKIVTVSIPKRGNAPSVKVTANTMKVNTSTAMEYCVLKEGSGTYTSETDGDWKKCTKGMLISDLSSQSPAQNVVVAIRKAETAKAAYSKCAYLEIPAQDSAPLNTDVEDTAVSATKFTLSIPDASTTKPYQYCAVKAAKASDDFDPNKASWKKVTSSKAISFASRTYPEDSVIYIRLMGNDKSKTKELKLPSECLKVTINYAAAP